ncbi:hypothetical protein BUN12_0060 [Bacillus amyloliquefaciens]|jgi:hypothetical protein|uniref:Uncharacterized protein n=1 Tax=Bacillus amyloliquefaciens (strain ATCC 23350 / DSM 7 / BCRC 11601 / CCUG 28519 / NBRC 15535 / NRRL B-14393 / F) TaxID=692420 RepID=A0A9P1JFU0_BACAS|nr:hypothetical protein [Bacillus amyloliquefaciens]AZV88324.1 hypothetical protein BUN12_0060 [Bacillus amyloliquefaciens]MDR4375174.1 hypothetical protein [Bacillus amyloliquefaciens]MEC1838049.1 hypothetical protein [Bacillus amyloliquefaciens]MEC1846829.1 hypothetical protein [Bacillus amyloliquefaciens]MEC1930522.1 hypothetical protein [Bacillus amyloliquefaciens]
MTINIPVSPDYQLTSDERNIIVKERYFSDPTKAPNWAKRLAENPDADPTPQEKWREVAFHSTVERALMDVMNRRLRSSDATSLAELARLIREFRGELAALLTVEGIR